jgi:hypothetical protein
VALVAVFRKDGADVSIELDDVRDGRGILAPELVRLEADRKQRDRKREKPYSSHRFFTF